MMTENFKTIADCAWGPQYDLQTELFIDGDAVARLYMDNDSFAVVPRCHDVPENPEDNDIFSGPSGAYYDDEDEIRDEDGDGGCRSFLRWLITEVVFVKNDAGAWVPTTRAEAGIEINQP